MGEYFIDLILLSREFMKKQHLLWGFLLGSLAFCLPAMPACAQLSMGDDIDAILEDNALREAITRYESVLAYFMPEEASHLGIASANKSLNDRSTETEYHTLQALESLQQIMSQIEVKSLSQSRKVEYNLLQDAIERHIWQLKQNRLSTDPLYYAQALDAIYELILQPQTNVHVQRTDLLARLEALPNVAKQAQQNLMNVAPHVAKAAMEKAYFAYVSFGEITQRITEGASIFNDERDQTRAETIAQQAKDSIRQMFELFKKFAEPTASNSLSGTGLSPLGYTEKLSKYYQINTKPAKLAQLLSNNLEEAQHNLFDKLQPFELTADEEVTIVEDLNNLPLHQLPATDKKNKQVAPKPYTAPTANQFEAVAKQLAPSFDETNLLKQLTQQASAWQAHLLTDRAVPMEQPLPGYFAYQQAFVVQPQSPLFFVRLPFGNQLAKEEMLQRDFNEPATKLFISQEIVPGRYYQTQLTPSQVLRTLGSPTLANGWTLYTLNIAQEQAYLITDEELLFAAWQRYVRALMALVEYKLYSQEYTYEQAMEFLTQTNGFSADNAAQMMYSLLREPGQAVSYIMGENMWKEQAAQYRKKVDNTGKLTSLLLQVGNVSPKDLPGELKRLYKK